MLSNTIQRLLTRSTPCAVSSHSLERCLGVELQNSRIADPLSIITAVAEQAIQSIITLPKFCVDFQNAPTEIVELSLDLQLLKELLACVQSLPPSKISNVDQERGITILTYNERLMLRLGCHTIITPLQYSMQKCQMHLAGLKPSQDHVYRSAEKANDSASNDSSIISDY